MKKLVCEMCGATDLIKKDGVYQCQYCGTKYSIEEAKKLLIDISGSTVKIDRSNELANLLELARRSRREQNGENAVKYYEMVLLQDPYSWEACFYTAFYKTSLKNLANIEAEVRNFEESLKTTLQLVHDKIESPEEQIICVSEVFEQTQNLSLAIKQTALEFHSGLLKSQKKHTKRLMEDVTHTISHMMYVFGDNLEEIFGDNKGLQEFMTKAWASGIMINHTMLEYCSQKVLEKNTILTYAKKIKEIDKTYKAPYIDTGGCYVATAVYGSYNCPQVWVLRRYRDNKLDNTWYGRAFIRLYYATSPILLEWFGETQWFKKQCKTRLDKMVTHLMKEGFKDTPYRDKY